MHTQRVLLKLTYLCHGAKATLFAVSIIIIIVVLNIVISTWRLDIAIKVVGPFINIHRPVHTLAREANLLATPLRALALLLAAAAAAGAAAATPTATAIATATTTTTATATGLGAGCGWAQWTIRSK